MTKAEEITRLREFIAGLSEGYLRDMLAHVAPQFECDVKNDFATLPDLEKLHTRCMEVQAEYDLRRKTLATQEEKLEALRVKIQRMTYNAVKLREAVLDSARGIERFARDLPDTVTA